VCAIQPVKHILTRFAADLVVAIAAVGGVVSLAAGYEVVSAALRAAPIAIEHIVAVQPVQRVVPGAALEPVHLGVTADAIVEGTGKKGFDARERHGARVAPADGVGGTIYSHGTRVAVVASR